MSLFLPQSRHISEIKGKPSEGFPTQATIQVKFEPADAFGVQDAENRTTFPANAPFSLFVDSNRGTMQLGGQSYIDLVRASHDVDGLKIELTGNEASISFEAESLEAAQLLALSLNDFMPAYLSLHLSVYVRIVSLILLIGDAEMRLTVKSADTPLFNVTDAERTMNNAVAAFTDWRKVGDSWVRFALAAYYFRHALRLSGLAGDGVVAVSEILLNLAKAIGLVFETETNTEIREKARDWGLRTEFIENQIIPIMILRSKMDVAHHYGSLLTEADKKLIGDFASAACRPVRDLLLQVASLVSSGAITLSAMNRGANAEKTKLLNQLKSYLESREEP